MRKKSLKRPMISIIIIIISALLLSTLSTGAIPGSAPPGTIALACLTYGENLDLGYTIYQCSNSLCTLCVKMGQSNWYSISLDDCNSLGLSCGSGSGSTDFEAPEITFISPEQDSVFNSNSIAVSMEFSESVKILKKQLNGGSLYSVPCAGCTSASTTLSNLADGQHTLTIYATDYFSNTAQKILNFYVDTKYPVIISTEPGDNYYVDGGNVDFKIRYTESFITSMKLYYKRAVDSAFQQVDITSLCPNGNNQECVKTLDLSSYPEQTPIEYYFSLTDNFGTATSELKTVIIDSNMASNPIIIVSPLDGITQASKTVQLSVLPNMPMAKIQSSINGGNSWTTVCTSSCNTQVQKSITLQDGTRTIMVRGTDAYGNYYYDQVTVSIDSKVPKIRDEEPGSNADYATSTFTVEYDELNLERFSLFFRKSGTSLFNEATRTDCPKGLRQQCSITISLAAFEGQSIEYYYEIADKVWTTKSRVNYVSTVDTTPPVMTVSSPLDYNVYTSRYVPMVITTDGVVSKIEYETGDGKWKKLCSNCNSYDRTKTFGEGQAHVNFRATDYAGNVDIESVFFYVDTKAPKISKLYPLSGKPGNNVFSVLYEEYNPIQTTLFAKKTGTSAYSQYVSYSCPAGKQQTCAITATSPSWSHGDQVEYYFTMRDIAGVTTTSKITTITIDTEPPVILSAYMQQYGTSYKLIAKTDANYYLEYQLDNGPWRRITSNGGASGITKTVSCTSGEHTLIFRAVDLAGNSATRTLLFTK